MTEVIRSEDCGNSPKNMFVQELSIALATRDITFLLNSVSDDIRWDIVGQRQVEGKVDFAELLKGDKLAEAATLTIHHVVTHGKAGAVNGTIWLKDGRSREFCDMYEFTNAKGTNVCAITSYVIQGK